MPFSWRSHVVALGAIIVLSCALNAAAHNGEPKPGPPMPPGAPPAGPTVTIMKPPPRWSWIHWWEANRSRFLHAPGQASADQAPDAQRLNALREQAAALLTDAIKKTDDQPLTVEAALALGKLERDASLPVLKTLAEKGKSVQVRRAGLLGIGLTGSVEAEKVLVQHDPAQAEDRVAALVAIGLLKDVEAGTITRLRTAMSSNEPAVATAASWAMRQHAGKSSAEPFKNILNTSDSPWVASESFLALGQLKDAKSVQLLSDVLAGNSSASSSARAWQTLQKLRDLQATMAALSTAAAAGYSSAFERYQKAYQQFYHNNPNRPPMATATPVGVSMAQAGTEQIRLAWMQSSAAIALGQIDQADAAKALLSILDPASLKDDYLLAPQGFAIMALASYPSEQSRDRLILLLGKRDQNQETLRLDVGRDSPLRGYAALALGMYAQPYDTAQGPADRAGYDWAILTLAERVEDEGEDVEVRSACAVGLGLSQRTAVLPVMNRLTAALRSRSKSTDVLLNGYVLLGRALAGDKNVIEPAKQFLLEGKDDTSTTGVLSHRAAVLALGVMRSPVAIPVLTKAWHLNHYVNREVILALRLSGASNAAKPVMDRLGESKDQAERAYMAQVLGELLSPDQPTRLVRLIENNNYTVHNDNLVPMQSLANEFLVDYLIPALGDSW
jgi:HEAT repeat protein